MMFAVNAMLPFLFTLLSIKFLSLKERANMMKVERLNLIT